MPQVSGKFMKQEDWEIVWKAFLEMLGAVDKQQSEVLVEGLFTQTERIMLTKRLVSMLLLHQGNKAKDIQSNLKLSKSTVYKNRSLLLLNRPFQELLSRRFTRKIYLHKDSTHEEGLLETIVGDILQGKRYRSRLHPTGYKKKKY